MSTKLKCTLVPVGMNTAEHWLTIGGFTLANVVNQPDRKLVNQTCVLGV